jgi:hypothetical protein
MSAWGIVGIILVLIAIVRRMVAVEVQSGQNGHLRLLRRPHFASPAHALEFQPLPQTARVASSKWEA